MELRTGKVATLLGELRPPSDKSLTHRAFMFGAIASGPSRVEQPLMGEDCLSTLHCLAKMGLSFERTDTGFILTPASEWTQPESELDCGNSGTTMRLLSGLIASRPISATLVGDASLSKRPMLRIATPLKLMGASVEGETPPLRIAGGELKAIDYISPVASAQIKSAILLAGLRADGTTWVTEPEQSRDHTERMLQSCGVKLQLSGKRVGVLGGQTVQPFETVIPGDISSAAFFLVAGAIVPGSSLILQEVGLNPSRTGVLDVLTQVGADFETDSLKLAMGEPLGDLRIGFKRGLQPFEISGQLVPRLVDEIPILAVLATQCEGTSVIRDAAELRVKESDRIELVANGLRAMGVEVETFADGMAIQGPSQLRGTSIEAHGDHRIAMSFAIAGLVAEGETRIHGAESIQTSFPGFEKELERISVF